MIRLKIFVDAHIFDHSYQGTHTYLKGLYNAMVNLPNVEIHLCASDIDNLKVHFTDSKFNFIKLKSHSKWIRLAFEIPSILKKGRFDFAHFQYITPFIKNTKFITTTHDVLFLNFPDYFPWSYRLIKGFLFKVSAKSSDIVLTVSEYSKAEIIKHFNISESKIHITPNAVQKHQGEVKRPNQFTTTNKFILFVSRFEPRKNQIGLLNTMLKLNLFDKGYDVVFVGSKIEKIEIEAYNNLINNIPEAFNKNVHFLDSLSNDELFWLYENCECFVYPSYAEGFGIPPLEAGIAGAKVLCSNTTAMKDFDFFPNRFNPYDSGEFCNQLNQLLSNQNYDYETVRNEVLKRYNWNKIALDLHQLILNYKSKK